MLEERGLKWKNFHLLLAVTYRRNFPYKVSFLFLLHVIILLIEVKHSSGRNIECLGNLFPHVVKEEEISKVRDEWMMYESDGKVEEIRANNRGDQWWRPIFKMKTLIGERKYPKLEKLINSVLFLHYANSG